MIRAIKTGGALLITADNESRADLAEAFRRGGYPRAESEALEGLHERYSWVQPETIGALTEAPILVANDDLIYPDDAHPHPSADAAVYWFPDYCIRDPWRELADKGRVVFTKGGL